MPLRKAMLSAAGVAALQFPASAADMSGIWTGSIRCSYGSGSLNITVARDGSISGGVTNGTVTTGRVDGRSVQFTTSNAFGNRANFTGRIAGDEMSGTYSQSIGNAVCSWEASLKTGVRTS